jgi:hypothetical protein
MHTAKKVGFIASLIVGALVVSVSPSYGAVDNQATEMTFSQPVRIPGNRILPAGTYWFTILADLTGTTNVVQIFNADGTRMLAQELGETTDPSQVGQVVVTVNGVRYPSSNVVLRFAKGGKSQPPALLAWFYPGQPGHKLMYSSRREKQLEEDAQQTIVARPGHSVKIGKSLAAFE